MTEKKKILIVDDEADLREVLCFFMEDSGYQVTEANCATQAIEILEKHGFDLIVSDVRMPNGSGYDLLKYIHTESGINTRTIMLTGFSDFSEKELIASGAHKVLHKPIKWEDLHPVIEEALA